MKTLFIILLVVSYFSSLAQTIPIQATFISRQELKLTNQSSYTLRVSLRDNYAIIASHIISPNSVVTIYGKVTKRAAKNLKLFYVYDKESFEKDINNLRAETNYRIRSIENKKFWEAAMRAIDKKWFDGYFSEKLDQINTLKQILTGDYTFSVIDHIVDEHKKEEMKKMTKNCTDSERRTVEALSVFISTLAELPTEYNFIDIQEKSEQCRSKFLLERNKQKGGETIWDIAANKEVFQTNLPVVQLEAAYIAIQQGTDNDEIHTFMGANEEVGGGAALSIKVPHSDHFLGRKATGGFYFVASYELHSFKVQTDYLASVQEAEGAGYQTKYAINNLGSRPLNNKIVIAHSVAGLGGMYRVFFSSGLGLRLQAGVLKSIISPLTLKADRILERTSTGSLEPTQKTPDLSAVNIFNQDQYLPYTKVGISYIINQGKDIPNHRKKFFLFLDGAYFWQGLAYNPSYRIAQLVSTSNNRVLPISISTPDRYWSINSGLGFNF